MDKKLRLKPLSTILKKDADQFQRKDLLKVIKEHQIEQINLHYTGLDGKLKELKIPINDLEYAELILAQGERVDGSNIFKGILDTSSSDIYILPIYKTAFLSPFEENTMGILCRFIDKDGNPAPFTPDNILANAHARFKKNTGLSLNALGELEFYIIYDVKEDHLFRGVEQRGYHQSAPFIKKREMINEMLSIISGLTGAVKYAHSEVGYIDSLKSNDPEINGKCCEQYEIEFLPRPIHEMGTYLNIAKWVVRNVAHRWGCSATFTPKLEEGMAGNGLHIHLELCKNGKNIMSNAEGMGLSDQAKKLIGGLCEFAPELTAFGNTVSSAYLRLVANQEAPTKIGWSEFNRSSLIRVPLGWNNLKDVAKLVNPNQEMVFNSKTISRQTVELRIPDGSAFIDLLLAAITVSVEYGLLNDELLDLAEKLHISKVLTQDDMQNLDSLPASCYESAIALLKGRSIFEEGNLFPTNVIDYVADKLKYENDMDINERFSHLTAERRLIATRALMHKDLHKH